MPKPTVLPTVLALQPDSPGKEPWGAPLRGMGGRQWEERKGMGKQGPTGMLRWRCTLSMCGVVGPPAVLASCSSCCVSCPLTSRTPSLAPWWSVRTRLRGFFCTGLREVAHVFGRHGRDMPIVRCGISRMEIKHASALVSMSCLMGAAIVSASICSRAPGCASAGAGRILHGR